MVFKEADNKIQEVNDEKEKLDSIIKSKKYQKSVEFVKKLFKEQFDIEFISKMTGLTKEELSKIN